MFSGSWKESSMEKIDIHIVDPNIDLNSLHIALGSLYQDEITVEPADVITILAAANLFQVSYMNRQDFTMGDSDFFSPLRF